jgi:uncharacterized protein (TIGR03067 family)
MVRRTLVAKVLLVAVALLSLAVVSFADEKADKAALALQELQGEWQAISMAQSGQDAPPDAIKEFKVTIKDDTITFVQGEMTFKHKFKIDPSQSPMHFDVEALDGPRKGKTIPGIYTLEQGELRICTPNDPDQVDQRPQEPKTQAGDGLSLLVLVK